MTPGSAFRRSREAAERALALDAGRSDAHAALSLIALLHDWDRAKALAHAERAIGIDPNYSYGHARQALALATMRRFDEAVRACERARALDPLSPTVLFNLSLCYFYAGRHADQLATGQRAVELSPLMPDAHRMVAAALFWSGKPQDAISYVERIIDTIQRNANVLSDLAGYLGAMGRTTEARAILTEIYRRSTTEPVQWVWIAFAHAMLGDVEEMCMALRRALDARDFWIFTLDLDTAWDPYRAEPRFVALMKESGLA
jgi:tetratricopeptide (TPR) repeat protein